MPWCNLSKRIVQVTFVAAIGLVCGFLGIRCYCWVFCEHESPIVVRISEGSPDIQLAMSGSQDEYGGKGAIAYVFRLKNGTTSTFKKCVITINAEYSAPLSSIEVYNGMWGNQPRGRDDFAPGETLEMCFSHDNSNTNILKGSDSSTMSADSKVTRFSIMCDDKLVSWTMGI